MSQLFTSGDQSIGASASAPVLPVNIQGCFPLGSTGFIPLQPKGLSKVFFSPRVWKHQLWSSSCINTWPTLVAQTVSVCLQCGRPRLDPWVGKIPWRRKWKSTPVLLPGKSHGQRSLVGYSPWGLYKSRIWLSDFTFTFTAKTIAFGIRTLIGQVMSLVCNMLSRLVIGFLPRSKCLLICGCSVTVCSDFGAQENLICHCFPFFPDLFAWNDGTRYHDLHFLNAEF